MLFSTIEHYIKETEKRFGTISETRKQTLTKISQYVAAKLKAGETPELVYICTHNSRRSHFGQIWAKTAAVYYGVEKINTYSGGTEATAFHPNAIRAIAEVGFVIGKNDTPSNPHYTVNYQESGDSILCFSKRYDDPQNPQEGFCAIMTCTEADGACPFVPGATTRVSTPYDDPKAFDNTTLQDLKYSERCLQIATETLYVFSLVKTLV